MEDGRDDVENWLSAGEYTVGDDGKSVSIGLECCVLSKAVSVGERGYDGEGGRCVCSKGIMLLWLSDPEGILGTESTVISCQVRQPAAPSELV